VPTARRRGEGRAVGVTQLVNGTPTISRTEKGGMLKTGKGEVEEREMYRRQELNF